MKLLVAVNQAEALRLGIDAPSSSVQLEVDPAVLTQPERDLIALLLWDGFDLRHYYVSQEGQRSDWSSEYCHAGYQRLTVTKPTLDGLREALAAQLIRQDMAVAKKAVEQAKDQTREAQIRAEADAAMRAALDAPEADTRTVGLFGDGQIRHFAHWESPLAVTTVPVVLPRPARTQTESKWSTECCDPELKKEYERACQAAQAEVEKVARPVLEQMLADQLARAAAEKAEHDALYARLPESLRARASEGLASSNAIEKALRNLLRVDAGYPRGVGTGGAYQRSCAVSELTDEQYARLLEVRAEAPEGATVTPKKVWNLNWRLAGDDEEADENGEVADPVDERIVARVEWSRVGINTWTICPLAPKPAGSVETLEQQDAVVSREPSPDAPACRWMLERAKLAAEYERITGQPWRPCVDCTYCDTVPVGVRCRRPRKAGR
jgi:hypothetical protein